MASDDRVFEYGTLEEKIGNLRNALGVHVAQCGARTWAFSVLGTILVGVVSYYLHEADRLYDSVQATQQSMVQQMAVNGNRISVLETKASADAASQQELYQYLDGISGQLNRVEQNGKVKP